MRYVGTGYSDITKLSVVFPHNTHPQFRSEWAVNQHRDTASTIIGHAPMLATIALVENESIGRIRYRLLEACCLCI